MKGFLPRSAIRSLWGIALATLVLLTARAASAQAIMDVSANNGDGKTRLLSQAANGAVTFRVITASGAVESTRTHGPFPGWSIVALSPFNNNSSRLLWSHVDNRVSLWTVSAAGDFQNGIEYTEPGWRGIDLASNTNGLTCFLWTSTNNNGAALLWTFNPLAGQLLEKRFYGPYPGWQVVAVSTGADNTIRLLWRNINGTASHWRLDSQGNFIGGEEFGPFPNWMPKDVSLGPDGRSRLLWDNPNGAASVWVVNASGQFETGQEFGFYPGWRPRAISTGLDSQSRLLWNHTDTRASLWYLDPVALFTGGAEYLP